MRIVRGILILLGFIFFALGIVGILLPVLPSTPFLLLASLCFMRGSARINEWFVGTKLYKKHLESFAKKREMTFKTKVIILSFASIMLVFAFLIMNNIYGRVVIGLVIVAKYYYFLFRIKTCLPEKADIKKTKGV